MSTLYTDTADVAQMLGFSRKTIAEWCKRGKFPGALKFPDDSPRSEWRIPMEDVEAKKRGRVASTPVSRDRIAELMAAVRAKSA